MRFSLLVVGLLCAAVSASVSAAARPGGMGTIGGQVLNAAGKPVSGVHVTLQTTDGGHLQITDTNDQGRFWFAQLPEGQYSVRASDGSRVSEWREGLWVTPGKQTNVVLHLRPKK
jgi:Carboxypeptidase regulatory-like domain